AGWAAGGGENRTSLGRAGSTRLPDSGTDFEGGRLGRRIRTRRVGETFFRQCLAQHRGHTPEARKQWRDGIFAEIREWAKAQGEGLTVEQMCELVPVSRASFYRHWEEQEPDAAAMVL